MKKNERVKKNIKNDKDRKWLRAQHSSEPMVDRSPERDAEQSQLIETPFHSRMDEHAATLSRIPFAVQRQEYIMRLNNTFGLRYVQRLLDSVNGQAKLTVSSPGDVYEQEADKVADEVTREINDQAQRQNQEEEEEELIQPMSDLQRQDEEEELQMMPDLQRQDDEEELQMVPDLQRQDDEEELQIKPDFQRQDDEEELQMMPDLQRQEEEEELQAQRQPEEEEEEELIQPMSKLQQREEIIRENLNIQRQNMATCEACGKEYDIDETGETCPYCGATEPLVSLEYAISQSQNAAEPDMATCESCGKKYDMNINGETCPYCGAAEPLVSLTHGITQSQNAAEPDMATCESCGKKYDMNINGETCPYCGAAEPIVSLRYRGLHAEGQVFKEEWLDGKLAQHQEKEEEPVQMKSDVRSEPDAAAEIEMRINSAKGGGQPLSSDVKRPMEQAFGTDFNDVKIHTDAEADTLNKQLNAKAFTTGQDIFFRDGEYSSDSDGGKKLIAHELTHVVQQTGRRPRERNSETSKGKRNRNKALEK